MNRIIHKDLNYATEDKIKELLEENQGQINANNLQALGELIDIKKDIANIEYWCAKEEEMDMYGRYDRDYRDSYDRRGRDGYGRRERDSRGRYRGHDYIDDMEEYYGRYMEGRGRYGAEESDKSYHYMVKALEDFIKVLHEEAETEQQRQQLRDTLQRSMR